MNIVDVFCRLQEMLLTYSRIRQSIPQVLMPLMQPFMKRVDDALKPGVTTLTWTSLNASSCKIVFCLEHLPPALFHIVLANDGLKLLVNWYHSC